MHIFLTGASTGIGNAIAREFDAHFKGEATISLVSRKQNLLEAWVKSSRVNLLCMQPTCQSPRSPK
jgi:NADP-dependent 3-hydroxy acid dehydrogenase YdfG